MAPFVSQNVSFVPSFFFPACFLPSFPPRPPFLLVFLTLPFLLHMEFPPRDFLSLLLMSSCRSPLAYPAYKCARCSPAGRASLGLFLFSSDNFNFSPYPKPRFLQRGSLQVSLTTFTSAFQSEPPPQHKHCRATKDIF